MVPDKFNIVDFGGFDLAGQYGEALPGIFDKIVGAHWNCVYIMCFGLKFAEFDIAPQYMIPKMFSDHIELNGIISIDRNDVITIPSIQPPAPEPVILPGIFEENGTFSPPAGVDGYAPVTVNVSGVASTDFVEGGPVIPIMTSNTAPSGTASASSTLNSSFAAYRAFDGVNTVSTMQGGWLASSSDTAPYVQYVWENATELGMIEIFTANNGPTVSKTVEILGLTSGGTWENCLAEGSNVMLDFVRGTYGQNDLRYGFSLNGGSYHGIKIQGNEPFYGGANLFACTFDEVQVYEAGSGVLPGLGYYGKVAPSPSLGTNGNVYTDVYTRIVYQKQNGSWAQI